MFFYHQNQSLLGTIALHILKVLHPSTIPIFSADRAPLPASSFPSVFEGTVPSPGYHFTAISLHSLPCMGGSHCSPQVRTLFSLQTLTWSPLNFLSPFSPLPTSTDCYFFSGSQMQGHHLKGTLEFSSAPPWHCALHISNMQHPGGPSSLQCWTTHSLKPDSIFLILCIFIVERITDVQVASCHSRLA